MNKKIILATLVFAAGFAAAANAQQPGYTKKEYQKYVENNPLAEADIKTNGGSVELYIAHMREQDRKAEAQTKYDSQKAWHDTGFISDEKFKKYTDEYNKAMGSADYNINRKFIESQETARQAEAAKTVNELSKKHNDEAAQRDKEVLEYFAQPANAAHKAEYDNYIQKGDYNAALKKADSINKTPKFENDRAAAYYYVLRQIVLAKGTSAVSPAMDVAEALSLRAPSFAKTFGDEVLAKCRNNDTAPISYLTAPAPATAPAKK